MPEVVLLYECSCPNVRQARANLLRAFSVARVPASWRELDRDAPDTPPEWRGLGSPTILVNGADVERGSPGEGATCRLYEQEGRLVPAPPIERIVAALHAGAAAPRGVVDAAARPGIRATAAAVPGVAIALLPKIACPACWPAYAAVLSAAGLGFLMQSRYLLPLTIALLALATLAIGFHARRRRGYAPAMVAGFASAALIIAKFVVDSTAGTYAATALFAAAALWNAWPRGRNRTCPACVPANASEQRIDVGRKEAHV